LLPRVIIETKGDFLLRVLQSGTVSTNVYLRRLHNFCLDMNWLPWPLVPKRQWPAVHYKEKRAITWDEHLAIVANEANRERCAFYECCWNLGAAQSDVASLTAEAIDWQTKTVSFHRHKTGTVSIVRFGRTLETTLRDLPKTGLLFPQLQSMREAHRSTEFARACRRVGVKGVTLHSYRYAWAERAKTCGYPERFAQEALGHQSKAVHRAYARKAQVVIPAMEDYERKHAANDNVIVPLQAAVA
jgi:integrase